MPRPKTHTTGHDDLGYSIFIHNPELRVFSPIASMIYSTKSSDPVDLEQNADLVAHEIDGHDSLVPKQGSTVVMMEWPPGAHIDDLRSLSVTVGVMIQGQITCLLDSGESRSVKKGELLIQRGTMHAWRNTSGKVAKMIFFVLPSQPVQAAEGDLMKLSIEPSEVAI